MKKGICLLAMLAVSSALYAQEKDLLGKEDLLAAFQQYNPLVLQKAAVHTGYAAILNELLTSYSAAKNQQNELELIALVKNFDNSIALQLLSEQYFQKRTLETMTGTALQSLQEDDTR